MNVGGKSKTPVVVIGAGPAGLGGAYQLARRGCFDVTAIEREPAVGGNAGSFEMAGLRVDFGSHRLHPSCAPEIMADIRGMLGESLLDRPRHGRIRIQGHWVHFPLKPVDLATHLPLSFTGGVLGDSLRKMARRVSPPDTFEGVLEHGLGRTICRNFYFPYARKIWGLPPVELDAEQARRRVSAGSLGKMVRKVLNAVPGFKKPGAGRFYYPKSGFGAISEGYYQAAVKAGARVMLGSQLTGVELSSGGVRVSAKGANGEETLAARQLLSTIPLSVLARLIRPAAPAAVLESASALRFRSMILIYLVLETEQFTEFDAHYFPDANIGITRLSEPKNYGLAKLPGRTVLCAELPCFQSDAVWTASDQELGRLVTEALKVSGIPVHQKVLEVASRRLPQAYPLYTREYREHFDRIDGWLNGLDGILTFGRQGLFAHDNTHHALAMAYAVSECLDDAGSLNRARWQEHRRAFQHHVVED
jgi:protoporphyrinogen oxidase